MSHFEATPIWSPYGWANDKPPAPRVVRKILIVSPHFPPINAPDMQRVRLSLPYLREQYWEPTVLALAPECIEGGVCDPLLEKAYPADVRIVRVTGARPWTTRWAGFGNLWFRCGRALAAAGEQLLQAEKFDLVFFSTTQFGAFMLGPKWRKKFGVPYVVDYQDPWVNDYYQRTNTRPPGGWLKFSLGQWSAKRKEPRVLRQASGIVSVSDSYAGMLGRKYLWFDQRRVRVLPFGTSDKDFAVLEGYRPVEPLVNFSDGLIHHVYAGRCGPDMVESLTVLFRAFRLFREAAPEQAARIRFHFIGTGYAPRPLGEDTVMPVAAAEGVADSVREHRYRVPYFDALYYIRNAPALVAVGSNDPGYSASKIFPYVLAKRPLLLVFHPSSLVLKFAEDVSAGMPFAVACPADIGLVARRVCDQWFMRRAYEVTGTYDEKAAIPFTAESLTTQLVEIFNTAIAPPKRFR